MKKNRSTVLALLIALGLVAAACQGAGGGSNETEGLAALTGSVNADGSSTVFPISQAVAEEFNAEAPDVKISVGTSGTGGGFKKFCAGETDISDASRPIKKSDPKTPDPEESDVCSTNGIEFLELEVAIDGLSILVNPKNTFVQCLTLAELKTIWEPNSKVKTWNEVRPGFPNKPISLYGPGTDSGTFDYFTDEINGEEGASRSDYVASENDNDLVKGIAGDENALGYFGYAYYLENKDKLKTVAVDGGDGCVQPSEESINTGTYKPLSRPLFIYVSKRAAARKEVSAFIDFYLETVNELVAEVGYVQLPEATLQEQIASWKAFKA